MDIIFNPPSFFFSPIADLNVLNAAKRTLFAQQVFELDRFAPLRLVSQPDYFDLFSTIMLLACAIWSNTVSVVGNVYGKRFVYHEVNFA